MQFIHRHTYKSHKAVYSIWKSLFICVEKKRQQTIKWNRSLGPIFMFTHRSVSIITSQDFFFSKKGDLVRHRMKGNGMTKKKCQCPQKSNKFRKTAMPSLTVTVNSNSCLKRDREPLKARIGFNNLRLFICPLFLPSIIFHTKLSSVFL